MKARKGFTLVELLMAVAILAVLAGVVVPRVLDYRQEARLARCAANISNIERAVETYRFNDPEGGLPADFAAVSDGTYFPQGAPDCEIEKSTGVASQYTVNANTGKVLCDHVWPKP